MLPRIGPTQGVQATAKEAPNRKEVRCPGLSPPGCTEYRRSNIGNRNSPVRCSPSTITIVPASLESHASASAAMSRQDRAEHHPECREDGRETCHEHDGAQEDILAVEIREIERGARELGKEGGDHGQHARREKGSEACEGGENERRFGHPYASMSNVLLHVLIGKLLLLARPRFSHGPTGWTIDPSSIVRNS